MVTSPSESLTRFLPVSKSFFADSTVKVTLVDGVPTDYEQDDKSELVGAFIIPAKVIGAYFEAAGQFFTAFSKDKENEIALIQKEKDIELAKRNAKRDLEAAFGTFESSSSPCQSKHLLELIRTATVQLLHLLMG